MKLSVWCVLLASTGLTVEPLGAAAAPLVVSLDAFGAVGDGVTDDGPALQRALDAIGASGGGTLLVPAGRYAIVTPVRKDFTGVASALSIRGVESSTPVSPPSANGQELSLGLDLRSEFAPRTGEREIAIEITGLESSLIQDIGFIGAPGVATDALVTLAVSDVRDATIRHCEFYGLSSMSANGAIVRSVRSGLRLEQTKFLGTTGNSSLGIGVVENIEWKGLTITDVVFLDYGSRAELYGKLGSGTPAFWVHLGAAAAAESSSPRREAVIRNTFFDEGAIHGLLSRPHPSTGPGAPIDLVYVSGLVMNVSGFHASGNHLEGPERVLIERSRYGYSRNADAAIDLLRVGSAILDQVECVAGANRIRADGHTGKLTVIHSLYTFLDSQSPHTRVITTDTPLEDPVQWVRQQFTSILGRAPDPAAHFYWSDRLLQCGEDSQCIVDQRSALVAYLSTAPSPSFSISGQVTTASGAGLAGVMVTLGGSQSVATETGGDGRYLFSGLPTSGVYTVTAQRTKNTFAPSEHTVSTPYGNRTLNFRVSDPRAVWLAMALGLACLLLLTAWNWRRQAV